MKDKTAVITGATSGLGRATALQLAKKGAFAGLLSIFKQCGQCFGPSYLKCTWLNKKYFGGGEAVIISNEFPDISVFIFNKIAKNHGRRIQSIEKDIVFELKGTIGGLLNNRIALHQAGNFHKPCPKVMTGRDDSFPISLKIINSNTKEVIAKYSAFITIFIVDFLPEI